MLQKRREEIEVIREEQGERRIQRGKRVEKLKAEHAKAAKARAVELKTAKKMMQKNQFKAFEKVNTTKKRKRKKECSMMPYAVKYIPLHS